MDVVFLNKIQNILGNLKDLGKRIVDPDKILQKLENNERNFYPGALTYIDGKLVYWDITKTSITNLSFGQVTAIATQSDNSVWVTLDDNSNFDELSEAKFYLFKRKNDLDIYEDIPISYKILVIDVNNKKVKLKPVDLSTFKISDNIKPDIKIGDKLYEAGAWQMVLSETTEINSSQNINNKEQLTVQLKVLQSQINNLQAYKTALEKAGYTEDDPEYIKTTSRLNLLIAQRDFYQALINCNSCDINDQNTWTDDVKNKYQAYLDAQKAVNVPPPSTKEIIVKSIDKIGLSVMGSIDIYMTGNAEDAPDATQAGLPSYISNYSQTTTKTTHFTGKDPGVVGTNENYGVNYLIIKGAYNADEKGTGSINFILDAAKAAGIDSQRGNYKYNALSALFRVKEYNFWDYTGGHVLWEYFINMTPVTNDPDSPDYGKFHISCEIKAYKDYHNAILGGRWFVTMNKFRNF